MRLIAGRFLRVTGKVPPLRRESIVFSDVEQVLCSKTVAQVH